VLVEQGLGDAQALGQCPGGAVEPHLREKMNRFGNDQAGPLFRTYPCAASRGGRGGFCLHSRSQSREKLTPRSRSAFMYASMTARAGRPAFSFAASHGVTGLSIAFAIRSFSVGENGNSLPPFLVHAS